MKTFLSALFLVVGLSLQSTFAQEELNWHQWRGPEANGVSKTANPPTSWSEDKNIRWKVGIEGRGTSTPIIWGNKVFILTATKTSEKDSTIPDPKDQPKTNFFDIKRPNAKHEFVVLCFDRETGKQLWRKVATKKLPHQGAHHDNDFASASPTTNGKQLFCWFGSAGLYCFDLEGKKLWDQNLGEVKIESSLGEGCSPVVYQDKLIIVRDHVGQSTIEVLNASTGKPIWKKERDERNGWATPLVIKQDGKTQVVTGGSNFIRSYDLNSGDLIWKCSGLTGNVTPCPVLRDDHVICMSGYQGYAAMSIPINQTGDVSASEKIGWKKKRGTPYIPSPVLYDNLLFYNQSNQAIIACVDATTGETKFNRTRLELSNIYASPVAARNRIYFVGRRGKTVVLEKSAEFKVIATNKLNERFDASPALAGNQLFLRGEKYLYCIQSD